jgi:hypothetical protein
MIFNVYRFIAVLRKFFALAYNTCDVTTGHIPSPEGMYLLAAGTMEGT